MIPRLKANAVVRVLTHGRTSPCIILATDAEGETHEVVIKWRSGPEQKDIGGICELACSLLADDLGLPTPKPSLIEIDEEFHRGIQDARLAKIVEQSAGLNFGGAFLSGHNTWPRDKSLPLHLQQVGLETFAFDVLVDNPDRRQAKPNILWSGGNWLFAITSRRFHLFAVSSFGNQRGLAVNLSIFANTFSSTS